MFLFLVAVATLPIGKVIRPIFNPRPQRHPAKFNEFVKQSPRFSALPLCGRCLRGCCALSTQECQSVAGLVEGATTNLSFSLTFSRFILPKSDGEGGRLP